MKPAAPESKHQRFVRLAEARTNKIIATLHLLGNCSSPSVYDYSEADVNKIFHAIKEATADAENRFRKKGSGNRRFTLS